MKDEFGNGNYTLSQYVIYINIFECRRNTTFDKKLDELALDEMSLDKPTSHAHTQCFPSFVGYGYM